MKFFQLEYMMAVCKYGSISKAADELMVSRPAVSRTVKDLEQEFGLELFHRTTSGVTLTEAGVAFYDKCLKIEKLVNKLKTEMEAIKESYSEEKDNWLHVGLTFTARCRMLPFLRSFSKQCPHARVKMSDISESFLDGKTLDPELDVIITLCDSGEIEGMDYIDVEESRFAFCCSKMHPLADRKSVSIFDIQDEPMVGLSGLVPRNNQMIRLYARHGLKPNIVQETKYASSVKQMIRENLCCSVQPSQSMEDDPEIAVVPIDESEKIYLRIIWNKEIRHKKVFFEFLDFARKNFGGTN
ncbi:MAG: LysR family transcriptional regulator [Ruminococcaceae bacterium]|nr:LysR family transcriptional regulator [Oscillospiraceae bacterium]